MADFALEDNNRINFNVGGQDVFEDQFQYTTMKKKKKYNFQQPKIVQNCIRLENAYCFGLKFSYKRFKKQDHSYIFKSGSVNMKQKIRIFPWSFYKILKRDREGGIKYV